MTFDIDPELDCAGPPPAWAMQRAQEVVDHVALSQDSLVVTLAKALVIERLQRRENESTVAIRAFADRVASRPQREAKAS